MNIGAYKGRFNARLGEIKKGSITRLFVGIVDSTPVLSGRLRANWNLVRGGQGDVVLRTVPTGEGSKTGIPYEDPSFNIERDVELLVDEKDGTYTIINPLPYALRCEYGWSDKAPEGMVRINMVKFGLTVKEIVDQKRDTGGRFTSTVDNGGVTES